ncbi:MAG: DSD1 family PLP-dependent enzyme, partial [Alphaproteobacteria bacterium]|nr:DSD1 family PLP-dependent enzyme [Alphaproteobacteria bacterium]
MANNPGAAASVGGEAIGCAIAAIDTPALLLDLDAMGRNIERMAAFARGRGL